MLFCKVKIVVFVGNWDVFNFCWCVDGFLCEVVFYCWLKIVGMFVYVEILNDVMVVLLWVVVSYL